MHRPADHFCAANKAPPMSPALARGIAAARYAQRAAQIRDIGAGHHRRTFVETGCASVYRVHKLCGPGEFGTVTQALAQWGADKRAGGAPRSCIIEIVDSATYYESPLFRLGVGEQLTLRAASLQHPVLRIFDYHTDEPGQAAIVGEAGSHFTLDGLSVMGGSFELHNAAPLYGSVQVTLRHCTLYPGWDCERCALSPSRLAPSLTLRSGAIGLHLDHCIAGPVAVRAEGSGARVPSMSVVRSILDGGHAAGVLVDDAHGGAAQLRLTVSHSTFIGAVQVRELALAANSIFLGALLVLQRGVGTVRYCYLAPGSRTPSRTMCQPDLSRQVRPRFVSLRCGAPGYGQLAPDCAAGIVNGADDDSAMGPFHDAHHLEPPPANTDPAPDMALS